MVTTRRAPTGGRHEYNGMLFGAPRGSFATLAISPPPQVPCSPRQLRRLVLRKCNPHKPPGPRVQVRGLRVIQDDKWECDTSSHEVAARASFTRLPPFWVASKLPHSHPSTLVCQNRFRVLSTKTCAPYRYSREITQTAVAIPIGVLSRIRPEYAVV
jgi:hypothetical protein